MKKILMVLMGLEIGGAETHVVELSLTLLSLNLAGAVVDLLVQKRASGVLRSTSSALSIMLGLILCYGMMILVSVTIMLLMGTPG